MVANEGMSIPILYVILFEYVFTVPKLNKTDGKRYSQYLEAGCSQPVRRLLRRITTSFNNCDFTVVEKRNFDYHVRSDQHYFSIRNKQATMLNIGLLRSVGPMTSPILHNLHIILVFYIF